MEINRITILTTYKFLRNQTIAAQFKRMMVAHLKESHIWIFQTTNKFSLIKFKILNMNLESQSENLKT